MPLQEYLSTNNSIKGLVSLNHSIGSWIDGVNIFTAGSQPKFYVQPRNVDNKRVYGSAIQEVKLIGRVTILTTKWHTIYESVFVANVKAGYQSFQFGITRAGHYLLYVSDGQGNKLPGSPFGFNVTAGDVSVQACIATWVDGKDTFHAGDGALLLVKLKDTFNNTFSLENGRSDFFELTISVPNAEIFNVSVSSQGGTGYETIQFVPSVAGKFSVEVGDASGAQVQGSPLVFYVGPGPLSVAHSIAEWVNGNSFQAGLLASLKIILKDKYQNTLKSTSSSQAALFKAMMFAIRKNQTYVPTNYTATSGLGYEILKWVPHDAGNFKIWVGRENMSISNSPLDLSVISGPISLEDTHAKWKYGINIFPPYQGVKLYVFQRDVWGNAVESLVKLQVFIYRENDTDPSPFSDVWSQPAYGYGKGTQLITFTTTASGTFSLYLEDLSGNKIGGCPYKFSVLASHLVQENKSVIYGSGVGPSSAGESSTIFVQLKDIDGANVDGYSNTVFAIISIDNETEITVTGSKVSNKIGLYKVIFALTISGEHNIIFMYCNIPLNSEKPFTKVVHAGVVSISNSVLVPTEGTVPHPIATLPHPVTILLKDEYGNLVPGQEKLLIAKFTLHSNHPPDCDPFLETTTGNYTFFYRAYEVKPCFLFIYYNGQSLPGFPVSLHIHSYGYFPHTTNDLVWTWEDTAIIIDVLSNDYFGQKPGMLLEITEQPINGVAYMREQKVVYVPQKGFVGNDALLYKVQDSDHQKDYGLATIFTAKHPPQIISIPQSLEVCEEGSLQVKSGDKAFMIYYSKVPSPIAYAQISTNYGQLQTAASFDLSWDSIGISASLPCAEDKPSLFNSTMMNFEGANDAINSALDALTYSGAFDFYGFDKILLSIKDEAGLGEEAFVIVKVKHVNAPPLIVSYSFILVDANSGDFLAGVDDLGREAYNTSLIIIMDDDIDKIEDDTSQVEVLIRVENGSLLVTLPENSTSSTEIKQEESYHWSPLPTAVFENDEFTTQAQEIKFRATLKECNEALNRLKYNGTADGTILSIMVNDLGHYGMDSVCSSEYYPLSVEMQLSLVFTKPMPFKALNSYWKNVMIETKVLLILGIFMTLTFMAIIICLFILVAWKRKTSKQKVEAILYKESGMDASRVYNPMWIPSAPSSPKLEFSNSSNPHHYSFQKSALQQGLADAHEEMQSLLGFHIKKSWASIKSFKSSSFKLSLERAQSKD